MSATRDLPARPSLDSLRKQAKKLVRDAAAANADAIARVRAQLPKAVMPLSNRDAQLVVAREYGFLGWPDLTAEVQKRLGRALDGPAGRARVAIYERDNDRLRDLLNEHPGLVTWQSESGQTLLDVTTSYALDCSDPERERTYNRPDAAAMLIDAGATVHRSTWEHVIATGARGMLQLFADKGVLPSTLPVLAALGDEPRVRVWLGTNQPASSEGEEQTLVGRALMHACRFKHEGVAMLLLERLVALDPDLGRRIDTWQSRQAFVEFLFERTASVWSGGSTEVPETPPWQAFVIRQLMSALDANDLPGFRRWLDDEPWLLEPSFVHVQIAAIERASWQDREPLIVALLDSGAALAHQMTPPPSHAVAFALDYGHAHLIPTLARIWRVPDDLPHAAGVGNTAAVQQWFDASGQAVLGPLDRHYPGSHPNFKREDLGWGPASPQQVLDVALAWACLNRHFDIALFLLDHGANINTNWSTHEPASILHECAIQENEAAVRFLIEHGADLTITDHRYQSTAEGWARYAAHNERIANLLAEAANSQSHEAR